MRAATVLKPENVIKRANDLINSAVGPNADKERRLALEQLHAMISVKKKSTWSKTYEELMKKHLELCVELKDHYTAKDGLHQYRNLCVNGEPNSLEVVILHLLELSENRASVAREKADKVALAAAARVSDLEQGESPESIMLSSMTEEGSRERTDREVVVPWLRFLWENYRTILELLYRQPKLEKVYHKTCEKAFKFCVDYSRKMEFRRLCEMLRVQLSNLQKAPLATTRAARAAWEWTPEAVEFHLQTRFAQLEVATSLELWNESFRTIEDISSIMSYSKKAPKAKLMLTFYDKLAKIFWVADNKLFHAYAWNKLYAVSVESRKDIRENSYERSLLASNTVLAALSIPSSAKFSSTSSSLVDDEELAGTGMNDKATHLSVLLDFHSNPTRQSLLQELVHRNLHNEVIPELQGMYELLEVKFSPLNLVAKIAPMFAVIKANAQLAVYYDSLLQMVVIKVLQQLSKVYTVMKLDALYRLFAPFSELTQVRIERMIMDGIASRQVQLKIDHSNKSISFNAASNAAAGLDTQLSTLGTTLHQLVRTIRTVQQPNLTQEQVAARKTFFTLISAAASNDHYSILNRKNLIEKRKEDLEKLQKDKKSEEFRLQELEKERAQKEEQARLEKIVKDEAEKKRKEFLDKLEIQKLHKELERLNVNKSEAELTGMSPEDRSKLLFEAQDKVKRAKDAETQRINDQFKTKDHLVRSIRIEEAKVVAERQAQYAEEDRCLKEQKENEARNTWQEQHTEKLLVKERLSRMQSHRVSFEDKFVASQRAKFQKDCDVLRIRIKNAEREKHLAEARAKLIEVEESYEEERQREREEEERVERARREQEQHERLRRQREVEEAAEREREAEAERARKVRAEAEAERAKRDADAKKLREEEREKKAAATSAPTATTTTPKEESTGGGWRSTTRDRGENNRDDREKFVSRPTPAPTNETNNWRAERPAASATGKYEPPSRNFRDREEGAPREKSFREDRGARPPATRDAPVEKEDTWRKPKTNANPPVKRNIDKW